MLTSHGDHERIAKTLSSDDIMLYTDHLRMCNTVLCPTQCQLNPKVERITFSTIRLVRQSTFSFTVQL